MIEKTYVGGYLIIEMAAVVEGEAGAYYIRGGWADICDKWKSM